MNSRECQHPALTWIKVRIRGAHFACRYVCPAHQTHGLRIEKKVTVGLSVAYKQSRNCFTADFRSEPSDIKIRKDIYVVDQEGATTFEVSAGMEDAASSLQKPGAFV